MKKLEQKITRKTNIQILVWFLVFVFLEGLLYSKINSAENPPEQDDLAKIDSGFFVSKEDVDGLQDHVFKEELTRFLTEEGILTRSARGFIYYYISENQMNQIENPEFKERVKKFVTEAEERKITPQKAVDSVHEVQSGDTLWNIAKRYGMSLDELLLLNRLSATDPIYPGQKLLVTPDWD